MAHLKTKSNLNVRHPSLAPYSGLIKKNQSFPMIGFSAECRSKSRPTPRAPKRIVTNKAGNAPVKTSPVKRAETIRPGT
jgi:hypothetical protein